MKVYVEDDGAREVMIDDGNRTVTVTIHDWVINERFVGTSICPENRVFDSETEKNIAKKLAEAQRLMCLVEKDRALRGREARIG